MALTVNSAPNGFQPVGGGELVYQFTEASVTGKPNYRVEIELNGLTVPIFEYRPDASLVVRADIAPMLRAALALDFTTGSRFGNTYVKYQAVWDGGSDSQVLMSWNTIYYFAGVDHALNHRTKYCIDVNGGSFLIPTDKLYVWSDRTAYVEFMNNSTLPSDMKVTYTPTGGSPVILGTFDGSVVGFRSFSYDEFYFDGTVRVMRVSDNQVYATIDVVHLGECDNPVYLKWVNDLGGISTWLFSYNQIFALNPQLLWRDKILTVETNILGFDQWKMLQELNKDGIEFGNNEKSGAYVVDFTDEAYPVNVFCLPENAETMTKMAKHNFSLSFRYAQLPNILL